MVSVAGRIKTLVAARSGDRSESWRNVSDARPRRAISHHRYRAGARAGGSVGAVLAGARCRLAAPKPAGDRIDGDLVRDAGDPDTRWVRRYRQAWLAGNIRGL